MNQQDETFDEFLTRIKTQSKKCNFGDLLDTLIRDNVVIRINVDAVREKLLSEDELTADKAIKLCRASEQATKQMAGSISEENKLVEAINSKVTIDTFDCRRCGTRHAARSCSAFGKKCTKCGWLGHFQKMCKIPRNNYENKR